MGFGGGVSWMSTVHVAGFELASVGGTEDDDGPCGLMHWGERQGEGKGGTSEPKT